MFEPGRVYHRRADLHRPYGGQQQGGISTPRQHPVIFLFTGDTGTAYGYEDHYNPDDGLFWYTGEGQVGDMEMTRGNRAIRDHKADGKTLHLFETATPGYVRYVGRASYVDFHTTTAPDRNGEQRTALVFELEIDTAPLESGELTPPSTYPARTRQLRSKSMSELYRLAVTRSSESAAPKERRHVTRLRSQAVRLYVLRRAGGVCEGCNESAPFTALDGSPYLEPHHIFRLADGGPDHPAFVAALCPTCHRFVHYGDGGQAYNEKLAIKIAQLHREFEVAAHT